MERGNKTTKTKRISGETQVGTFLTRVAHFGVKKQGRDTKKKKEEKYRVKTPLVRKNKRAGVS